MDKQKLNEEAFDRSGMGWDDSFQDGFKQGAEWVMERPLSERLTDWEKGKIK